jgi:hypothetical protein
VHGNQFAAVEDLIRRAFVQDEKLTLKAHARTVQKRTDTELNYVQNRCPHPVKPNQVMTMMTKVHVV